jgi:hypothetical protein
VVLSASLDPELQVTVGWQPVLGGFIARVEGIPTGALLDLDGPTVAWFGSRHGELQTVQDLQDAIGDYAILGDDVRAALEADRIGRADQAASGGALGILQLVASAPSPSAEDERLPDPSTGRALLELALMVVVLILGLIAVIAGAANR